MLLSIDVNFGEFASLIMMCIGLLICTQNDIDNSTKANSHADICVTLERHFIKRHIDDFS